MSYTIKKLSIEQTRFGSINSSDISLFTLTNTEGTSVQITNFGGIITSIITPDKYGKKDNIVLGYPDLESYIIDTSYHGAIIGRYANRIERGEFTLDNINYKLSINDNTNHLHGGDKGFGKVIWEASSIEADNYVGLKLTYLSKDLEEGYPGNLTVEVVFKLTNSNELHLSYFAKTDKKTIVNLTQHPYFNLTGDFKNDILDHYLKINADHYLPIDDKSLPLGEMQIVANTPFDFKKLTKVKSKISSNTEQIKLASGFDHSWVLNKNNNDIIHAASVEEKISGRCIDVFTTKPALQFYSGNFLEQAAINIKNYKKHTGFCLETQLFPNSPNMPKFPSACLLPNEVYRESTIIKFSIKS